MNISLELQETLREGVMENIDVNKIEQLVQDRTLLLAEMNRILEQVILSQNLYLNSQAQHAMAEIMADEITGFGPAARTAGR